ncbi:hypothetical protein COBT_001155 [Conglomerata obtusa]
MILFYNFSQSIFFTCKDEESDNQSKPVAYDDRVINSRPLTLKNTGKKEKSEGCKIKLKSAMAKITTHTSSDKKTRDGDCKESMKDETASKKKSKKEKGKKTDDVKKKKLYKKLEKKILKKLAKKLKQHEILTTEGGFGLYRNTEKSDEEKERNEQKTEMDDDQIKDLNNYLKALYINSNKTEKTETGLNEDIKLKEKITKDCNEEMLENKNNKLVPFKIPRQEKSKRNVLKKPSVELKHNNAKSFAAYKTYLNSESEFKEHLTKDATAEKTNKKSCSVLSNKNKASSKSIKNLKDRNSMQKSFEKLSNFENRFDLEANTENTKGSNKMKKTDLTSEESTSMEFSQFQNTKMPKQGVTKKKSNTYLSTFNLDDANKQDNYKNDDSISSFDENSDHKDILKKNHKIIDNINKTSENINKILSKKNESSSSFDDETSDMENITKNKENSSTKKSFSSSSESDFSNDENKKSNSQSETSFNNKFVNSQFNGNIKMTKQKSYLNDFDGYENTKSSQSSSQNKYHQEKTSSETESNDPEDYENVRINPYYSQMNDDKPKISFWDSESIKYDKNDAESNNEVFENDPDFLKKYANTYLMQKIANKYCDIDTNQTDSE